MDLRPAMNQDPSKLDISHLSLKSTTVRACSMSSLPSPPPPPPMACWARCSSSATSALPRSTSTCRTLRGASAWTLPVSSPHACTSSGEEGSASAAHGRGRSTPRLGEGPAAVGDAIAGFPLPPFPNLEETWGLRRSTQSSKNMAAQQETEEFGREKHDAKSSRLPVGGEQESGFQVTMERCGVQNSSRGTSLTIHIIMDIGRDASHEPVEPDPPPECSGCRWPRSKRQYRSRASLAWELLGSHSLIVMYNMYSMPESDAKG